MTRSEFLNDVNWFGDLIDFCYEVGCNYCENIIDYDELDEEIDDYLSENVREKSWKSIKEDLDCIPEGYDYYLRRYTMEYEGLTESDFLDYKDDVLDWADSYERFDEEDIEDEVDKFYQSGFKFDGTYDNEKTEVEEEDLSVDELLKNSWSALVNIKQATEIQNLSDIAQFNAFISSSINKS